MSDKVKFIDSQDPKSLPVKVGEFLLSKGFDLASCLGIAERPQYDSSSIGILYPSVPRTFLFGLIKIRRRRTWTGTIWFNNSVRGADKQNWIFEVHGQENINPLKKLAEEMVSIFDVKINLHLTREKPDFELFSTNELPTPGY